MLSIRFVIPLCVRPGGNLLTCRLPSDSVVCSTGLASKIQSIITLIRQFPACDYATIYILVVT